MEATPQDFIDALVEQRTELSNINAQLRVALKLQSREIAKLEERISELGGDVAADDSSEVEDG